MKNNHKLHVLFSCWILLCTVNLSTGDSVQCLSCTYTFAGDGTTDLECVTNVTNYIKTSTVSCTSGRCETRAVYTNEYKRLNSLFRGCNYESNTDLKKCDPLSDVYPTCVHLCSTPTCNNKRGDDWSSLKKEDNNGGVSVIFAVNIYLLVVSLVLLI